MNESKIEAVHAGAQHGLGGLRVLVTAGAGGIGLAIAERLIAAG